MAPCALSDSTPVVWPQQLWHLRLQALATPCAFQRQSDAHLQILIARYGVTRNVEANQRDLINTVIPNQHASEVALLLFCYEKLTAKPGPLVAVVVQVHPRAAGRLGH